MNQVMTEAQELRQFAEERLAVHLAAVHENESGDKEQRRRVFNHQLITYIDELNHKCREISGGDCERGNKSLHGLIDEYQRKFLARY